MKEGLTIGIIGAGSFAAFAARAFMKLDGVTIAAVSDVNEQNGKNLSGELNAIFCPLYAELLANKNIDLVYIATPPYLHVEISKNALLAGKNVICEKPGALNVKEAEEVQLLARQLKLLYVVNLMQRYNPLYGLVKTIFDERMMGNFLHGFFENYASDENLNDQHWFWNETKSGGIFMEHGVHFFDLFSGWLGKGKMVNALQIVRKNSLTSYDRVQATVLYGVGTVNFYHGFDQPTILDRQEMRLEFERGEVTLYEWIPVKIRIHGLFKNRELKKLADLMVTPSIINHNGNRSEPTSGETTSLMGFDVHATIESGNNCEKQIRYQEMLASMLQDQWDWIKDNSHVRTIDDDNGLEALKMAEHAKTVAKNF